MYSEMLAEANLTSIQRDFEAQRWTRAYHKLRRQPQSTRIAETVPPGQPSPSPTAGGAFARGR